MSNLTKVVFFGFASVWCLMMAMLVPEIGTAWGVASFAALGMAAIFAEG